MRRIIKVKYNFWIIEDNGMCDRSKIDKDIVDLFKIKAKNTQNQDPLCDRCNKISIGGRGRNDFELTLII